MRDPINCTGLELSTYLAVLAEGYLPTFYLDINLSAPSRSMVIASKSYQQGKKTVHFPGFQFSMTLQNLTVSHGEESLMSSRVDSLAKTSHALEKVKESTGIDQASGTKCSVSFAKFDPDTFTLKTAQCSWLEDSMSSYVDLPTAGTMSSGQLFQQVPLAHVINVTVFGFLPDGETFFHTPNTGGLDGGSNSRKALKKRQIKPANLRDQVSNMDNWKMWPTPSANEPGVRADRLVDKDGNVPTHPNQRLYDKHTGRLAQKGLTQAVMFPTPQTRGFTNDGDLMALANVCDNYEEMSAMAYRAAHKKKAGYWATPQARDFRSDQASRFEERQQKNLNDAVAKFPTPTAEKGLNGGSQARSLMDSLVSSGLMTKDEKNKMLYMGDTADSESEKTTSRLNPYWVESYLMLWPRGWTALEPLPEGAFYSMQPHDEPDDLPRVTSNCPNRAARLRAIGNGQVPMCAATAFKQLKERLHDENR